MKLMILFLKIEDHDSLFSCRFRLTIFPSVSFLSPVLLLISFICVKLFILLIILDRLFCLVNDLPRVHSLKMSSDHPETTELFSTSSSTATPAGMTTGQQHTNTAWKEHYIYTYLKE